MTKYQGMHNFEKLNIWIKSKKLAISIYKSTRLFPSEEKFGLTTQMRRSAISIPANIAEGAGRKTKKDFSAFINISLGSLNELFTFLEISKDLKYIDPENYSSLKSEINYLRNMISLFNKKLSDL
jgi:four helix bundle protein